MSGFAFLMVAAQIQAPSYYFNWTICGNNLFMQMMRCGA